MADSESPQEDKTTSPGEPLTFEGALAQLEGIVQKLEEGQLGLSDALAQYELGVQYLKHCYRQLQEAERRIELLTGVNALGQAATQPYDERAMSLEEKQQSRSQRRSHATPPAEQDSGGDDDVDASGRLF